MFHWAPTSVAAKWHENPSNGLSRVRECDRRQTDDRPRCGEVCSYMRCKKPCRWHTCLHAEKIKWKSATLMLLVDVPVSYKHLLTCGRIITLCFYRSPSTSKQYR